MPSIVLKITSAAADAADATEREVPRGAGPLFSGNGDTDYLCGNCGFVIAAGMGPTQHVIVDHTTCPACGATNEFPVELRN
jgi:ribosomal protein S27AE